MNRRTLLLAAILVYAAGFRLLVLDRPFEYDAEGHGSFFGVLAREYLRFGWTSTRGMPLMTAGQGPMAPVVFYRDHPPTVPLQIVPFYAAFGVGEWQTRLPTSIETLAAIAVLYLLLLRVSTVRVALVGAALYAGMPMNLFFGGLAEVVGMPLGLFAIASTATYVSFHDQPNGRSLRNLVAIFSLAAASDWPAFILVPVFLAHFLATQPRRRWPWIAGFGAAACAVFAALYVYIVFATDASWDWMLPLLNKHSAIANAPSFTAREWLSRAVAFNRLRHTTPILLASGAWLIASAARRRSDGRAGTVARLLLAWGILHVCIGRQGVFDHEWWWSPLTPGLAVSAALFIDSLAGAAERRVAPALVRWTLVVIVALFAAWTAVSSYTELYPASRPEPYTTREMGAAIQIAAPAPSDVALIVGSDLSPEWWFYGDRPLRLNVWTGEEVERRRHDEIAEIVYGFEEPWNADAAGIVFPTSFRSDVPELAAYLETHYRRVPLPVALQGKFDVYDLRRR